MLSLKQPNYPVFFLTESGCEKYNDPRTNSLHEAVRFARQTDLMGMCRHTVARAATSVLALAFDYGFATVCARVAVD